MTERLDLDAFGPWRDAICEGCEVINLVTGPPQGPLRCRGCWTGNPAPRMQRRGGGVDDDQGEPLFEVAPYNKRREGA